MPSFFPRLLPALLSGVLAGLTALAQGPLSHFHFLLFLCLLPVWSSWLRETSSRQVFWSGWVFQLTLGLVGFHWIAHTIREFSHLGTTSAVAVLLLYCAVANLHFPLAGWLWHRLFRGQPPATGIFALALLSAAAERAMPMLFPWNLGYSWLFMGLPAGQLAEFVGFRGLSTLTFLFNGALLLAWGARRSEPKAWRLPLAIAACAFLLLNGAGWLALRRLPAPDKTARILVIQPKIGNLEKKRLEAAPEGYRAEILDRYLRLTDLALQSAGGHVDFALWPENAFPDYIVDPGLSFRLSAKLREYLSTRQLNLLTGSYGANGRLQLMNSLFALDSHGRWASPPYEKLVLLPLGEYIPGAERFPVLKKWLPDVRDYGRGSGAHLLELAGIRLGPQICYEGLFDFVARDLANLGAQIIVNVTNDSWYGDSQEPWQHLYATAAKAVETRRPIVRGTNTGISAVALPEGRIESPSPLGAEWARVFEVPYRSQPAPTLFMGWGYWIDSALLLLGLLWLAIRRRAGSGDP